MAKPLIANIDVIITNGPKAEPSTIVGERLDTCKRIFTYHRGDAMLNGDYVVLEGHASLDELAECIRLLTRAAVKRRELSV